MQSINHSQTKRAAAQERSDLRAYVNSITLFTIAVWLFTGATGATKAFSASGELPAIHYGTTPDFRLPQTDLERLKKLALGGDRDSSNRVLLHYTAIFQDTPNARSKVWTGKEYDEMKYWATIEAENGTPTSMTVLGNILVKGKTAKDCYRAIFWWKRGNALETRPEYKQTEKDALRFKAKDIDRCLKNSMDKL